MVQGLKIGILFFLFSSILVAQDSWTEIRIKDAGTGKSCAFANVVLYHLSSGDQLSGTVTDESGMARCQVDEPVIVSIS